MSASAGAEAAAPPAPAAPWSPPDEVDEYRLLRPLGAGAAGRVFLAHDTLLERAVAVKFLAAPDSSSLARFLVEARAAARVQHPNVATLYRVGQVEDRAYLVSEYVRGTSLAELPRPMRWEAVLDLALDLARGLAAAHRRGVLHRDLKPGNAMVGEDGEAKLVDFGLARLLDDRRPDLPGPLLVGTPYFMSPEAWRGEELTVRSDLYSLGAVLYELCAGRGPHRDVPPADLPRTVQQRRARPLALLADVDRRLAAAIDRCLEPDPSDRFPSADDLVDALEQVRPALDRPVPDGNPYRGLQAFEPEHRALFFGRRRDLRAVLDRLRSEAFVLVAGDSGVGKSSLCLAGVLPAARDGTLAAERSWSVARLVPGRHPVTTLAAALASALRGDEAHLEQQVRSDPAGLARAVRRQLGSGGGLLVLVDQLEELVAVADPEEARLTAAALAQLSSAGPGLRVLATARSDFLTRLAGLPSLGELVPSAVHLLRPLGAEEVREAILGPARMKGARFESDDLLRALIEAGTDGGLPLLQFTLAELWEARRDGVFTMAALEALGGVSGALARHADGVLERLLPVQREAARMVLLRLVTADGTRARRSAEELAGADPAAREALEALVRGRLITVTDGGYQIAHEALLGGWTRLAGWLGDDREQRALRERVQSAAEEWERSGRPADALWAERRLSEVAQLDPSRLGPREAAFLAASRRSARALRLRRRALALAFALTAAAIYAGSSVRAQQQLRAAVSARLEQATEWQRKSRARTQDLERARRDADALFDAKDRAQGEAVWTDARRISGDVDRAAAAASEAFENALSLDPSRDDVRAAFADLLLERALFAEVQRRPDQRDELLLRLRAYDREGSRWAAWEAPATLWLTTDPTGAQVEIARIVADGGRRLTEAPRRVGVSPVASLRLPPDVYEIALRAPGRLEVRYPIALRRGEVQRLSVPLPAAGAVPGGFAYVPAGRFPFGSAAEESVREFFGAVPLHPVELSAFLIARHETTYAEWIAFLGDLQPPERARRSPHVEALSTSGQLDLRSVSGHWQLRIEIGGSSHVVREGEKLTYPGRSARAAQDWLRLPVAGVSFDDARAYASWLDRTGRVPGARLCTEQEWERAARGADDREFPHGDALEPDDANFDLTYGKQPRAFGPDEVGSHPASRSPFGVDDLAGNVWEWVQSSLGEGPVARGGSYYASAKTCRLTNRQTPEPTFRAQVVGVRICATPRWAQREQP